MNKKAFIKWQIKELLPIYIISFVLLAVIFWFSILGSNLIPNKYPIYGPSGTIEGYNFYYYNAFPPLFAIGVPVILLSFVLPFGVFSYQTSHIRSDFFYQVPLKEKELRRMRLLLNLIIAAIIITIIYWIGVLFIYAKQASMNAQDDYFRDRPYFYNYIYFLPYYFILIVSFACNYFISSYFISLGTRVVDSVFYLIFGQFILALTIISFLLVMVWFSKGNETISTLATYMPSPSFIEPLRLTYTFSSLLMKRFSIDSLETGVRIASSVSFLALGSFLGWYMLFQKKDPSGEYAGRGTPSSLYISLYPHVFSFVNGLSLTYIIGTMSLGVAIISPIFFILWEATYYFSIVLTNGGFRFNPKNWFGFGGVSLAILVLTIVGCLAMK